MTTVRYSPDYSETNPYQRLLTDALAATGVEATPVSRHDALMPLFAVRDGRPDVLHVHWLHPFLVGDHPLVTFLKGSAFLVQLLALSLLDVRLVWTVHNVVEHDPRAPRLERAFRHLLGRLADGIIVHCPEATETVLAAYRLPDRYRDRIHVVPHGHYVGAYADDTTRESARAALDLGDEFVFVFFGRIAPYKNVPQLIRAFRGIDVPDRVRLVVAGNPTDPAVAEAVRDAREADDRVRLALEFIPPERIQRYMHAADVVVLPFEDVLSSGSVVTAMSFGRPVLIPDIGCSPALLPADGGFCYAADAGTQTLRTAMARLVLNAGDLDAAGRANRAAIERFDWGLVADRTARVYRGQPLEETKLATDAES